MCISSKKFGEEHTWPGTMLWIEEEGKLASNNQQACTSRKSCCGVASNVMKAITCMEWTDYSP